MTLDEAKTYLGNKHLLHPDNNVQRRPQTLSALEKHTHQSVIERHVVDSLVGRVVQGRFKCTSLNEILALEKAQ